MEAEELLIVYFQSLCNFLSQPNSLRYLDLSSTDIILENVSKPTKQTNDTLNCIYFGKLVIFKIKCVKQRLSRFSKISISLVDYLSLSKQKVTNWRPTLGATIITKYPNGSEIYIVLFTFWKQLIPQRQNNNINFGFSYSML